MIVGVGGEMGGDCFEDGGKPGDGKCVHWEGSKWLAGSYQLRQHGPCYIRASPLLIS
jgi:hypothetical protein